MSESATPAVIAASIELARLPDAGPFAPPLPVPSLLEARVIDNARVGSDYWRLTLDAPHMAETAQPGQFAMLTLAVAGELAPVLPRPMALYGWDAARGTVDVVYRVVGDGTRRMTGFRGGDRMVAVGPLGRGFIIPSAARHMLLLGRGIGTCSLTALAQLAARRGIVVDAVVSARSPDALVGTDTYRRAGAREVIEVVDTNGSSDVERVAAAVLGRCGDRFDEVYTCGSLRLLGLGATLAAASGASVQVSLEAHMACGLGFCHGCSTGHPGLTREKPLVCADGPVFRHTPTPSAPGAA